MAIKGEAREVARESLFAKQHSLVESVQKEGVLEEWKKGRKKGKGRTSGTGVVLMQGLEARPFYSTLPDAIPSLCALHCTALHCTALQRCQWKRKGPYRLHTLWDSEDGGISHRLRESDLLTRWICSRMNIHYLKIVHYCV